MYRNDRAYILQSVASVENPVYKSFQGKYFIGQSKLLNFGYNGYAYGILYNPRDSNINLYVSVITITNTSNIPIKSRIYINSSIPEGIMPVDSITPSNLAIYPQPKPLIRFFTGEFITTEITGGVKAFTRMVSPNSTLVNEKNGKIVIPPGGNMTTELVPPQNELVKADIAYGWWEE